MACPGTTFREEIDPAQDHIASQSDDTWNRDILRLIEQARVEELNAEVGNFAQQAKADMGFKHLAWLLGAMGGRYRSGGPRLWGDVGCGRGGGGVQALV